MLLVLCSEEEYAEDGSIFWFVKMRVLAILLMTVLMTRRIPAMLVATRVMIAMVATMMNMVSAMRIILCF